MEWIKENVGLFVIIIGVFIVMIGVLLTYILLKLRTIVKNTVDSSLKMEATVKSSSDSNEETVTLTVYNTNFRDVIIHGFGFGYKDQNIDFGEEYMKTKLLADHPAVPARSYISFDIDPLRLEKFVLNHNYKSKKIDRLFNVVTDSVGNRTVIKNKTLKRWLAKRQKNRLMKARLMLHEEKVAAYQASHNGKKPLSDGLWRFFHPRLTKAPELVEKSETLAFGPLTEELAPEEVVETVPSAEIVPEESVAPTETDQEPADEN